MEFGLEKCAKATFVRGRLKNTRNLDLDTSTTIKELQQEGTNKSLEVNEGYGIQCGHEREDLERILKKNQIDTKSELSAANWTEAIDTLATPVITYSFNIINCLRSRT